MASTSTESNSTFDRSEWEKAQSLELSVDLISAAQKELSFLAIVYNTAALKKTRVLRRAVERYLNCWLPLVSANNNDEVDFVAPLDCAWIWHCHRLNPVQYGKDCRQLFGKLVDVRTTEWGFTYEAELVTRRKWETLYPDEPFAFIQGGADHSVRTYPERELCLSRNESSSHLLLDFDLVAAAKRQEAFYHQVCQAWIGDSRYLQAALERYKGFLYLMNRAFDDKKQATSQFQVPFLVPTYDIDLMWHSHQLCPSAYRLDTMKYLGKVLNHDDTDSDRGVGQRISTGFLDTCRRWEKIFGTVYERAGAMYMGAEPTPVPPLPIEDPNHVVTGYPATSTNSSLPTSDAESLLTEEDADLTKRETMKVQLVLFSARNIPQRSGRKTYSYVRISALRKCEGLSIRTSPVECSSDPESIHHLAEGKWNQGFSLQAEVSTEGLKLELMTYTRTLRDEGNIRGHEDDDTGLARKMRTTIQSILTTRHKCVGEIEVNWRTDLLERESSPPLSLSKLQKMMAHPTEKRKNSKGLSPNPELHFSVSVTPPIPAPHIFRILKVPVTDDTGLQVARKVPYSGEKRQEGRWVTRVVTDHKGQEQFVVRTRFATGVLSLFERPRRTKGDQKVIHVHRGSLLRQRDWLYQGQFLVRSQGPVVGVATQLPAVVEQGQGTVHRHWSLLNDAAILLVNKPNSATGRLECHIQGNLGLPFRLLPGRRLEYEVGDGSNGGDMSPNDDFKFQTFVRYTPQTRRGKATALINWLTGSIEVQPEESVVLILLITAAIHSSLVDMRHPALERASTFHGLEIRTQSKMARGKRNPNTDGELGAMLIERNGLSSVWNGPTKGQWRHDKSKKNTVFSTEWWNLTDDQILTDGGRFGGTQCGSGACGAGACGGGGCSTGVGGSFYFQNPDYYDAQPFVW